MRRLPPLIVVGTLAAAVSFSAAQTITTAKDTDLLKTVKDKSSAEAALPKLKPLDKKFAELQARRLEKTSDEERKLLNDSSKLLEAEQTRIEKLPEAAEVLKDLATFRLAQIEIAMKQISMLDRAVKTYSVKNNKYPESLKALTEGDKPILQKDAPLQDPWKKPYRYDAKGPKNKGETPDIWTVTPENVVIGNWKGK